MHRIEKSVQCASIKNFLLDYKVALWNGISGMDIASHEYHVNGMSMSGSIRLF